MMATQPVDQLKQAAAEAAVALIENGMIVGLGSGSTAAFATSAIGRRVREGLRIVGIPTSEKTADQARKLNIPLATLGEHPQVDLAIDGADEAEVGSLDLIKGGGGNQLREKIVEAASARFIVIVDSGKVVDRLGLRYPVPVEVIRFGWEVTFRRLESLGISPKRRTHPNGEVFLTDENNYILDCACGAIPNARKLQADIDGIVGVVEHGLFIGMAERIVVAGEDGVTTLFPAHEPA